ILSLRKKRGADRPIQARATTPAALSPRPVIWCSPTSRIACLRSKPIPASRFSIWQPESRIPDLPEPSCLTTSSTLQSPVPLAAVVVQVAAADAAVVQVAVAVVAVLAQFLQFL